MAAAERDLLLPWQFETAYAGHNGEEVVAKHGKKIAALSEVANTGTIIVRNTPWARWHQHLRVAHAAVRTGIALLCGHTHNPPESR